MCQTPQGIQHLRKAENIHLLAAKSTRKVCAAVWKLIFFIHTQDKHPSTPDLLIPPLSCTSVCRCFSEITQKLQFLLRFMKTDDYKQIKMGTGVFPFNDQNRKQRSNIFKRHNLYLHFLLSGQQNSFMPDYCLVVYCHQRFSNYFEPRPATVWSLQIKVSFRGSTLI